MCQEQDLRASTASAHNTELVYALLACLNVLKSVLSVVLAVHHGAGGPGVMQLESAQDSRCCMRLEQHELMALDRPVMSLSMGRCLQLLLK
jgi:hypothetical protein